MAYEAKPNTADHEEKLALIREARSRLMIAKKVRGSEIALRLDQERARIEMQVDAEIADHEEALNITLLNGYASGISIHRIAREAFDTPYDTPVRRIFDKLAEDGRWEPKGRLTANGVRREVSETGDESTLRMPELLSVDDIAKSMIAKPPTFTFVERDYKLADLGDESITADIVRLTLDARDNFLRRIEDNIRPGSPYRKATSASLYRHPATGAIVAIESNETGSTMIDHPVARWAKINPETTERYFEAALAAGLDVEIAIDQQLV